MASSCPQHCDDDTPSLRKVLAKCNRTRGNDIVISRGDAIVSDDGLVFKSNTSVMEVIESQSVSIGGDSTTVVAGAQNVATGRTGYTIRGTRPLPPAEEPSAPSSEKVEATLSLDPNFFVDVGFTEPGSLSSLLDMKPEALSLGLAAPFEAVTQTVINGAGIRVRPITFKTAANTTDDPVTWWTLSDAGFVTTRYPGVGGKSVAASSCEGPFDPNCQGETDCDPFGLQSLSGILNIGSIVCSGQARQAAATQDPPATQVNLAAAEVTFNSDSTSTIVKGDQNMVIGGRQSMDVNTFNLFIDARRGESKLQLESDETPVEPPFLIQVGPDSQMRWRPDNYELQIGPKIPRGPAATSGPVENPTECGDYWRWGWRYSPDSVIVGQYEALGCELAKVGKIKKLARTSEDNPIPKDITMRAEQLNILTTEMNVQLSPDVNGNVPAFAVEVNDGLAGGFSTKAVLEAQAASVVIAQGGLPEPRQASLHMDATQLRAGVVGAGTAYAEVSLEVDQAQLKLGSQALGSPSTTLTAEAGKLQAQLDSGAQETASCQLTPQQASLSLVSADGAQTQISSFAGQATLNLDNGAGLTSSVQLTASSGSVSFSGAPGAPSTVATAEAGQVRVQVNGQGIEVASCQLTPTQARLQVGSVEAGNPSSTATVTPGQVGVDVIDAQSRTASCSLSPEEARLRLGTELLGGARSEISARPERLQARVNEAAEVASVSLTKSRAQLEVAQLGASTIANVDAGSISAITAAEAQYAQVSMNPQTASISLGLTSSQKPGASASISQDGVSLEVNSAQDEASSSQATLVATEAQLRVTGSELATSASVQAGQISGLVASTGPGGSFSNIVMTPEQTQLVLGQGGVENPATTVTLVPEKVSVLVGAGDETSSLVVSKNSIQLQTTRLLTPLIFGAQLDAASQGPTVVSADWTARPLNAFEAIFSGFESGPDSITFTKAGAYKVAAVSSYFNTDPAAVTATAVTITRAANGAVLVIPGTLVYGSGTGLVEAAGLSVEVGDVARLVYKTTVADPEGLGKANPFGEASLRASVAFS